MVVTSQPPGVNGVVALLRASLEKQEENKKPYLAWFRAETTRLDTLERLCGGQVYAARALALPEKQYYAYRRRVRLERQDGAAAVSAAVSVPPEPPTSPAHADMPSSPLQGGHPAQTPQVLQRITLEEFHRLRVGTASVADPMRLLLLDLPISAAIMIECAHGPKGREHCAVTFAVRRRNDRLRRTGETHHYAYQHTVKEGQERIAVAHLPGPGPKWRKGE